MLRPPCRNCPVTVVITKSDSLFAEKGHMVRRLSLIVGVLVGLFLGWFVDPTWAQSYSAPESFSDNVSQDASSAATRPDETALRRRLDVGQDPPGRPLPSSPRVHRFFDLGNNALTAAAFAAQLGDAGSTLTAIRKYGGNEANPLARPFIDAGWPGTIAGVTVLVSADVGIRYWLHRTNHHRIERWMPSLLIATGTMGTIHNIREMNRLERQFGRR